MGTRPPAYRKLLQEHGDYIRDHAIDNCFDCIACPKIGLDTTANASNSLKKHIDSDKHIGIIAEYNEMRLRNETISDDFREPRLSYLKKDILKKRQMILRPWADVRINDLKCEVYCKLCKYSTKELIKKGTTKYLLEHENKIRHNTLFKENLRKDFETLLTNRKYRIQKILVH